MKTVRQIAGDKGEYIVKRELKKLDSSKYIVLNGYAFVNGEDTTQIDHLVLSLYGIFVIETKNYSGELTIDLEDEKWSYVCVNEKTGKKSTRVQRFENTYMQNEYHINFLSRLLRVEKSKFASMVVFANRNLSINDDMEDCILWYDEVVPYIKQAKEVKFTLEEIGGFLTTLRRHVCSDEYHLKNKGRLSKGNKKS